MRVVDQHGFEHGRAGRRAELACVHLGRDRRRSAHVGGGLARAAGPVDQVLSGRIVGVADSSAGVSRGGGSERLDVATRRDEVRLDAAVGGGPAARDEQDMIHIVGEHELDGAPIRARGPVPLRPADAQDVVQETMLSVAKHATARP